MIRSQLMREKSLLVLVVRVLKSRPVFTSNLLWALTGEWLFYALMRQTVDSQNPHVLINALMKDTLSP
jgi:ferric iron reductase protein FhuF